MGSLRYTMIAIKREDKDKIWDLSHKLGIRQIDALSLLVDNLKTLHIDKLLITDKYQNLIKSLMFKLLTLFKQCYILKI